MSPPLVIGFDPGIANFGYSIIELGSVSGLDRVIAGGIVRTKKSDKKRLVRAAEDNVERGREVAKVVLEQFRIFGPERFVAICAEAMSFPRNSSAAAKMAMTWGIIETVSVMYDLPIMQATPKELKKAVAVNPMASKEDIIKALSKRFGAKMVAPFVEKLPESIWEHFFDSLGTIVACYETDTFRLARKMRAA